MGTTASVAKAVLSSINLHERLRALAAIAVAAVGCVLVAAALAAPANAGSLRRHLLPSAVGQAERATAPGPLLSAASARFRTVDVPGAAASSVTSVNSWGTLVGAWSDSSGNSFGFIEFPWGQPITFNYPGTAGVTGTSDINDFGTVVGLYVDSSGVPHGFVRSLFGKFTPLDDPAGAGGTIPEGINDRGVIVGVYFDTSGAADGFVYDHGTFTTLDYPGASATGLAHVNDSGAIVGAYTDAVGVNHGFLYKHGTFTTIDAPGAGTASGEGTAANGISSDDVIVGDIENGSGTFGWLLREGEFSSLNDPNAAPGQSLPLDISSNGRFVSGEYADTGGVIHGFVATLGRAGP